MPINFSVDDLGPITDFRARPNTAEYMAIYDQPGRRDPWPRFGYPRPGNEPLDEFVENVAQLGISRAVFTGRQGSLAGDCPIPNDYIAECVGQFPQRLTGFAGIDPLTGDAALAEVRRTIFDLKLSGIAMDPPRQLSGEEIGYDNEKYLFPVYELAQELDVPVILTMGPMVAQFGDPWPVDRVAATFPDLKIVCSHGVWPQVTELISLAYRRSNVYLEASIYEFLPGAEPFIDAASTIIADQVVYASAFPFNPLGTLEKFLQFPIPFEAMKKVVSENALKLLGPIPAPADVVAIAGKASQ